MTGYHGAAGASRLTSRRARADRQRHTSSWPTRCAVAVLILQMAIVMLAAAARDAPVFDEGTHVVAGILNLRDHDLRWNAEHPPLIKALAGLATLGTKVHVPRDTASYASGDEFAMAHDLLYRGGNDGNRLVWLARLPLIALTLVFGLVVFGFAKDLFGTQGGLIALAVFTLCPTMVAHGHVVHGDVAVAGFLLATMWFLWRSILRGTPWFLMACLAFGLALLSKFTALFAIPAIAGFSFWSGLRLANEAKRGLSAALMRTACIVLSGVAIVWIGYLAISPHLQFQTHFYDSWAQRTNGVTAFVIDHLPFPRAYRVGLRFAAAFDQSRTRSAYLLGETYSGGKLAFYPVVLALKTPLGALMLWGAGLVFLVGRARRCDVLWALVPVPLAIGASALFSGTNIGIRHIAVVPMFASVVVAAAVSSSGLWRSRVIVMLLLLTGASVWRAFPDQFSYVNEAFGGSSNAYKLVADSNVDWGQDLKRLGEYLQKHPEFVPIGLVYFGTADPSSYGIKFRDLRDSPRDEFIGVVAISVSWLNLAPSRYAWLEEQGALLDRVGNTILIYHVDQVSG